MQTSASPPVLETTIITIVAFILLFCVAIRSYRRSDAAPAIPRPFDLPLWPFALFSTISALACVLLPVLWQQLYEKGAFALWQLQGLKMTTTICSTTAVILEVTYPISLAADQKPMIRVLFTMNLTISALFLGVAACKLFDRGLEIMWALPLTTHFSTTLCFAVAHSALSIATDKLEMLKLLIFSMCVTLASGTATLPALFGYHEIHFALQNCLCLFYLLTIILRLIQNLFKSPSTPEESFELHPVERVGTSMRSNASLLPTPGAISTTG